MILRNAVVAGTLVLYCFAFCPVWAQQPALSDPVPAASVSPPMFALPGNLDAKLLFPSAYPDRIILNLTENPETSVAVNWRTDLVSNRGEVEVALSNADPHFTKNVRSIKANTQYLKTKHLQEPEVEAHYHSALIDGLIPGQQYLYRVGQGAHWSEWFQFKMPDTARKGLSFLYLGDAQNDLKSMWSRVIREAYKSLPQADFVLHAGDLINRHDRDADWGEWFHGGSFIHATVPSMMTPGNHEFGKGVILSPQWRPQFNLPTNGPKGLEETCFQVNYPSLKVISLDGEQIDESDFFLEKQAQWLDSVLLHDPRPWTVITTHYPFYSTKPNRDNPRLMKHFKPILDKHKVDLVLQGHDHAYGRSGAPANRTSGGKEAEKFAGTVYVVSVAGPKMYDVSQDSWMVRRAGNTQLFQTITIQGEQLQYQAFTATGELYDAFILKKRGQKTNKLVNNIPTTPEKLGAPVLAPQ
jgi:acid phosphatase type 7